MNELIMWIIKCLIYSLGLYMVYILIFGVILFKFHKPQRTNYEKKYTVERFYGKKISQDQVHLVEDRYYANQVMNNLVNNAEKSIDIAYFMLNDGLAAKAITFNLIKAADRGVQVRILLDGLANRVFNSIKEYLYIYATHPNITVKFYEPFNLLRPSTWNNRMHDKIIIIDEYNLGLIGGQNIDDKYLTRDGEKNMKFSDRDVVIVNTNSSNKQGTVINDMKHYFDVIFNHKYSKEPIKKLTNKVIQKGNKKKRQIVSFAKKLRVTNPELFNLTIDWNLQSIETNGIKFIYNPITRLKKEPWCFIDIARLIENAKKSVLIENPFVIPIKQMLANLYKNNEKHEMTILTNSLATNSHVYAHSGYKKFRQYMIDKGTKLYEYQGKDIIHAKSFVIDQRLSIVGAYNLDARSTYLSTESMIVIDSEEFAQKLEDKIMKKINNSLQVTKGGYSKHQTVNKKKVPIYKKVLSIILYPISYVLDYML
ncbi:phospholipase D-like domain-containing protein [Haloplasma contractile]|uniref:Hydrolase protein n=1 Tax=Haloplasma contractile SSD-17B TaxID=1033810 RepID=U2E9X3_9MOLU|nr:phosphatidylserine/phosphatidylglycerophosphate/cardiolipin synthase family protein [Haloplasma contractile]ERJ11928.1 putative hydrolase protein [Haloplasma contractile SSD-17B]